MKQVLFAAGMLLVIGLGSSCKKEYTCKCTFDDGAGGTATSSVTFHATKKDAKDACNATATTGGSSYKCELE